VPRCWNIREVEDANREGRAIVDSMFVSMIIIEQFNPYIMAYLPM
jgi:hypothetical protein